jgi:hypothetical protein
MRCTVGVGLWVVVGLAAIVPPSLSAQAAASQTPPDASNKKSKEGKAAPPVHVKGKVVDRDAKPRAGSQVIVAGPAGETKTTTDPAGAFTFEGPPGKYTITVTAGGKTRSIQTDVSADKELPPLVLEQDF